MILAESLKCLTENKNSSSRWIEKHREVTGAPSSRGLSRHGSHRVSFTAVSVLCCLKTEGNTGLPGTFTCDVSTGALGHSAPPDGVLRPGRSTCWAGCDSGQELWAMVGGCRSPTCPPRPGGQALSRCAPGLSGRTCEVTGAGLSWGCPCSWSEQGHQNRAGTLVSTGTVLKLGLMLHSLRLTCRTPTGWFPVWTPLYRGTAVWNLRRLTGP